MDPRPRRRRNSKDLPPNFSELMNKLTEAAASFIKQFDNNEPQMWQIIRKMRTISERLKQMQETKDRDRRIGARVIAGAVLTGVGILAAPFTGGLSFAAAVVGAAAVGEGGGARVVYRNIIKQKREKESVQKVEDLGEELKKIIEPLKETLQEIKTTCEQLEQKSAEARTEITLRDVEEFKEMLRRVPDLKETSGEVLDVTVMMIQMIRDLLAVIVAVFTFTSTPEKDQKLRDAIIQSADQSEKVLNDFKRMKEALREFTGRDGAAVTTSRAST
ncbi:uncharacterized protein LOC124996804 [Mugil cephalus]|uniref:uncharacterized protein LOC124996804 n=1 Tax=Mugil cephalus TaxID=48193 RepID=UPI001FB59385|nr:uncharacterized protein LOC124996804 [Mugil cephalus]XP_047426079.1 uncharacterized protein LOC124996804 [Mugil cephalus]